jgi:hypothetical protein
MKNTRYYWHILMKLVFSQHIFEKYTNIKFYENLFSWSHVVPCGQMNRRDETNSSFSQFCERSKNCDI